MKIDIPITLTVNVNPQIHVDELQTYIRRIQNALQETIWMDAHAPINQVLASDTTVRVDTPAITLRYP
jgi:hypothetical protein